MTSTDQKPSVLTIVSFGYGHQEHAPPAHLTLDLRAHFRDPHVQPGMREMTGRDPQVIDTVLSTLGIPALIAATVQAARAYLAGPSAGPLRIAAGCVGGRHRSVVVAAALGAALADLCPTVTHLHIDRPVLDRSTPPPAHGAADPWRSQLVSPAPVPPSYPTAGGARTEVIGPDPWGAYRMPCIGCGTVDDTGDINADHAENAAHRAAHDHAQHCTRLAPPAGR
ncbi:RNase adapter RapZ [Streptomyces sp. Isolate_45]|uniref:RapZ C-terminal domain-containing protein n=1 Tax=Streptomyces sp. Isolate_45 TaxID=2950111 RepID=UPI002481C8E3|nr:RNase adapter RapZ [Streptomyces sp. Isolate_45]MDA5284625.1 hypothetical protein [Streptomyces sp. Isolate_45]